MPADAALKRLAERLVQLRKQDSDAVAALNDIGTKRREIAAEIARLEETARVLRELVPGGRLEYVDDDAALPYGDLLSKTLPQAAYTILQHRGVNATTRDLLNILVKAGKVPNTQTSHINLLNALKRNTGPTKIFTREGSEWGLTEWAHGDSVASRNGHRA
jgi:hypothetical protein